MKTDQLIAAMAADARTERPIESVLPWMLLGTCLVVGSVFLALVGIRPDPGAALRQATVLLKQGFPFLLAIGAFGCVLRLARPGARVGGWIAPIAAVPLLLGIAVLLTLRALPPADWYGAMLGGTRLFCLTAISLMSLPILAGSLWVLQRGASARPGLTGAAAGLMSGAAATALYAIHCNEDSPLFYATWYVLAMLVATGLGALLGSRLLRW